MAIRDRDVALARLTQAQLREMHYQMALIRRFEEKAAQEYTLGKIGGFLHLYIGQEASRAWAPSRRCARTTTSSSSYREHGHAILKGIEPEAGHGRALRQGDRLSARARAARCTCGATSTRCMGGQAIVGGAAPIATGLGFAIQVPGRQTASRSCSSATARSTRAPSTSRSTSPPLWKLPVVFICENNQYSMGMAVQRRGR